MARDRAYREWRLEQVLPAEMDAFAARDIMLDCFYHVHGAHFEATKEMLGVTSNEKRVRQSAKGALRIAFRHVGGNYDEPTKKQLEQVSEYLSEKSRAWGTPDNVIARHQREMQRVFSRVKTD
ncbi:MAG: hypothetical protein CVT66_02940 [Actinobacteria bacterium HGW-Actinobacteria-6]|nr:MAG: hypothetical protein CVT66_02940 [Actinobacteria bacterium HGW-Actinobacteria-6]